jgi:hypothetical protein
MATTEWMDGFQQLTIAPSAQASLLHTGTCDYWSVTRPSGALNRDTRGHADAHKLHRNSRCKSLRRHGATSRRVAGSRPEEANAFFQFTQSFEPHSASDRRSTSQNLEATACYENSFTFSFLLLSITCKAYRIGNLFGPGLVQNALPTGHTKQPAGPVLCSFG